MRVFLTGATGFIGSALVPELVAHGHQVLGLARSENAATSLAAMGAEIHRGDVEDIESLRAGAAAADGVIHAGFIHDFTRFVEVCEIDRRAIEAMGAVLAGSDRPLVVTSGTGAAHTPGRPSTEDDPANSPIPRVASEQAVDAVVAQGVHATALRLPQVHDPYKQGLISPLIEIARAKGVVAYIGDGQNRWPAVHRLAAAQLYRLALEKGQKGARYHAVAEQGVTLREICETIGQAMNLPVVSKTPEEAAEHFGPMGFFVSHDMPSSSALTQERLGWRPTGPTLIEDLSQGAFVDAV